MKNETRDRLVRTARMLFWEHGYAGTGIAQILKAADAGSGSLYYFFPTKEDLLSAVLEHYKELLWPEVVQPVFDRVSDPIERIFGILEGYRRLLESTDYLRGCPIGNLALELAGTHPAARRLIAENFTGWLEAVEMCLADASGRLPESVDRKQLALFVLTTMEGAVMLARAYRNIAPYDAAVTQLRDYFDRLLRDGTDWSAPRPDLAGRKMARTKPGSSPRP
jgi:TetR/AcrR family transcriptional repressor of nem operon